MKIAKSTPEQNSKKQFQSFKPEPAILAVLKQRILDLGGSVEGWQLYLKSQEVSIGIQALGRIWAAQCNNNWHLFGLRCYAQYLEAQNGR